MAALAGVQTSARAADSPGSSSGGHFASISALASDGSVSPNLVSSTIHAGSCYYQQGIDNAHISTSSTTRAVQSHGWWLNVGGTCPSKSNVDTYLQAVYCTSSGCGWRTVDVQSGDVYAGGGSGKWITAHEDCSSTATVGFRSYVDVDLIGVSDPSGYTYSPGQDLACYPSS
jgi:hypothetical protein